MSVKIVAYLDPCLESDLYGHATPRQDSKRLSLHHLYHIRQAEHEAVWVTLQAILPLETQVAATDTNSALYYMNGTSTSSLHLPISLTVGITFISHLTLFHSLPTYPSFL